jgi:hypothetical protein
VCLEALAGELEGDRTRERNLMLHLNVHAATLSVHRDLCTGPGPPAPALTRSEEHAYECDESNNM